MESKKIYRINQYFIFDPEQNTLTHSNNTVLEIEPMVSGLLLYLIQRSPQPVPHGELIEKFWGPTVKGKEVLMKTISKVRKLFPVEVIRTVSKIGYQWIAEVEETIPAPTAKWNEMTSLLSRPAILIALIIILTMLKATFFPHTH